MQDLRNDIPKLLLVELQERFPLRAPSLSQTDKEIWFEAGKQAIITFLTNQYNQQQADFYSREVLEK